MLAFLLRNNNTGLSTLSAHETLTASHQGSQL